MTNLWYEIKKLGIMLIDNKCNLCRNSLENFKNFPLTNNDVLVIVPNVNCHGKITHYHIGRIKRRIIENTKINKDLEGDKE